jgi:hypothetical protein
MGYQYSVSYAPSGRAQCRACGRLIKQDSLRISRESGPVAHFGDAGITNHFHYKHAFDAMSKGRCTSNVVQSSKNLKGFAGLLPKDKKSIETEVRKFSVKWKKRCPHVAKSASRKSTRKSRSKRRSKRWSKGYRFTSRKRH